MQKTLTKILLIEDSQAEVDLVIEFFNKFQTNNYVLEHVNSLNDALMRLKSKDVDLLLMDLTLPDSMGLDTYMRISSRHADIPTIVMTHFDDSEIAERLIEIGVQDYLIKNDINKDVLEAAIRNSLARATKTKLSSSDVKTLIEGQIESYKSSCQLFHDAPLSQSEPAIFNELVNHYKTVLPMGHIKDQTAVREKVRSSFQNQSDAILMLKISPMDLQEIHNTAINSLQFIDKEHAEFKRISSIVFFEVLNYLFECYSLPRNESD